jgi:hypothetical protein
VIQEDTDMRGIAVVTVLAHSREDALSPWVSKVLSRDTYRDVHEDHFRGESHYTRNDPDTGATTLVEMVVDFHEYAPEF